jgi:NitT/TauT family transport system permease protein
MQNRWQKFKLLFQPFAKPNKLTRRLIILYWILSTLFFWFKFTPGTIPKPDDIIGAWYVFFQNGLLGELLVSLALNIKAMLISLVICLIFAYSSVMPFMRPVVNFLAKCRFFGMVGFTLIFQSLTGGGEPLKLTLLVFGMSTFLLTSIAAIVKSAMKEELDYARTLRMSHWRMVWEIIILGKADQVIEAFRQNAAIGWMMLTTAEGIVRSGGGIGVLLLDENKHIVMEALFALQFTVFTVGILQDGAIAKLKNIFCPYAKLEVEEEDE